LGAILSSHEQRLVGRYRNPRVRSRLGAMYSQAKSVFAQTLAEIESAGLWKHERILTSPQAAHIRSDGREVVNFCANNYLGLSSHPRVTAAARAALDDRGYGLSSVRFICGTQDRHKE